MTKNIQFNNIRNEIWVNGEWWCNAGGEHCADVIATALNELIKENENLEKENYILQSRNQELKLKNELLDAENTR